MIVNTYFETASFSLDSLYKCKQLLHKTAIFLNENESIKADNLPIFAENNTFYC